MLTASLIPLGKTDTPLRLQGGQTDLGAAGMRQPPAHTNGKASSGVSATGDEQAGDAGTDQQDAGRFGDGGGVLDGDGGEG